MKEFLERACHNCGFVREKYIESNLPKNFNDIIVIPFFGDKKHEFILATTLLNKLKEQYKYIIICSWENHGGFFSMADEYWSISKISMRHASDWNNTDGTLKIYEKQLVRYFNVLFPDKFEDYYCNGFKKKFFENVVYCLPEQPSIKVKLAEQFSLKEGKKVFLYPVKKMQGWYRGKINEIICKVGFWEALINKLLEKGYAPIIYRDECAYDLSPNFFDKCIFIENQKILDLFGIIRACDCVIDVFSQISMWSIASRTPFIRVMERHIFNECKEFEINDLFANKIPHKYIFAFTTMLESGVYIELINMILAKVDKFLPTIDLNKLPYTSEIYIKLDYGVVRDSKEKIGLQFLGVQ